jgi:hypothetical protein
MDVKKVMMSLRNGRIYKPEYICAELLKCGIEKLTVERLSLVNV